MSVEQLRDNVHLLALTREVRNPNPENTDAKKFLVTVMSLFNQLRMAGVSGGEGGGGGGKGGRTPVAINAFDLFQNISRNLSGRYSALHSVDDVTLTLEKKLISICQTAIAAGDELEVQKLVHQTAQWIGSIHDLLTPVAKAPIRGKCPVTNCGAETIRVTKDGETTVQPALWMYGMDAYCHECGSEWTGGSGVVDLRNDMLAMAS